MDIDTDICRLRSLQIASTPSIPPLLRLPTELLDIVLEFTCPSGLTGRDRNSYRHRTLLTLALTCRRLRPIAERRMYHAITTYNLRKIEGRNVRSTTLLPNLYQTLEARQDLAGHVRMLHLFAVDCRIRYDTLDPNGTIPLGGEPVFEEVVTRKGRKKKNKKKEWATIHELRLAGHLLKLLPNLTTLKLQVVGMDKGSYLQDSLRDLVGDYDYRTMLANHSMGPFLQNLEALEHCGGELHGLFWTLPKLQRLIFNHRTRFQHDVMLLSDPKNIQEVETVHSTGILTHRQFSLTHETRQFFHGCQNLRRLTITFVNSLWFYSDAFINNVVDTRNKGGYEALSKMLQHCRKTLQMLSVDYKDFYNSFCPRECTDSLLPIGELCHFTALKELKLPQAALLGGENYMRKYQLPVTRLLPPNLEHLSILQPEPSFEGWLKGLLQSRLHFKGLRTITLRYYTDNGIFVIATRGTRLMDRLRDAGIEVKVEFGS